MKELTKDELVDISNSVNKGNELISNYIDSLMAELRLTIPEWKSKLTKDDFISSIESLFTRSYLIARGSEYFTWTPHEDIQKDFEGFTHKMIKNTNMRFFHTGNVLFQLKEAKSSGTTRSESKVTTKTIDEDGNAKYYYNGITYDGFGITERSIQQTLIMDISNKQVNSYMDSSVGVFDIPFLQKLDTSFIEKKYYI